MSLEEHRENAARVVRIYLLTVSDTRTPETDTSGEFARELVETWGQELAGYEIVPDEPARVRAVIERVASAGSADVLISNGGTGISPRDNTYEAVSGLLTRRLDGFGELFRMLSYQEIGSAAMLSRAVAGIVRGLFVFATPGSTKAVKLAMEKLILPEVGHLVRELRK